MQLAIPHITDNPHIKDALCLSVLALLIVIVFWPALFEGRLLLPTDQFDTMTLPFSSEFGPPQAYNHNMSDGLMQSYAWKMTAQNAFRHGEFFFWNPLILNGYPQSAASRQTYDIFNLLLIPIDLPYALNLILVLEIFTAAVGMYVLLRVHGRSRLIALMFAAAWMFNGMFLTDLLIFWALATFCWVPFALAMSLQFHRRNSSGYLLAAGFFLGLALLGSTIQSAMYAIFCFVTINALWSFKSNGPRLRKIFTSVLIPCGIALCLSAVMWLPAVELFLQVSRHGTLYSPTHTHTYSLTDRLLSFILLATFFVPELLGIVRSMSLTSLAGLFPMDYSGYLGFAELLLGLWAMFSLRFSEKSVRPYVWLVAGGFLLPIFTPLFAWLYHRFFIVGTLGLTVLGAERLESFLTNSELRESGRTWAKWALRILLTAFILLCILNLIWTLSPAIHSAIESFLQRHAAGTGFADGNAQWVHDRVVDTFQHYSIFSPMMLVPFGVAALVCLLIMRWNRWSGSYERYFVIALLACSTIHSVFWWRSYLPMLDSHEFPLLPQQRSIAFLQNHLGGDRAFIDRRGYPGRQYLFLDNLPSLYSIPVVSGYESEIPRSFYPQFHRIFSTSPHAQALGLLGVKYLMFLPGVVPSGTLPIADSSDVMIYRDTFARPRASLYYRSAILSNDSAVLSRIFNDSTPFDEAYFSANEESPPPLLDDSSRTSVSWEPARIVKAEDNAVEITAVASRPAYLVLSDTYYPGWMCFVDGTEQPIYRVNYAMRAVALTAGIHKIDFVFWPYSAVVGGWLSFSALLFLAIGCAGLYWRSKRASPDR